MLVAKENLSARVGEDLSGLIRNAKGLSRRVLPRSVLDSDSGSGPALVFHSALTSDLVDAMSEVAAEFARASAATYVNSGGVLQTVSENQARFESDGLLLEAGATNKSDAVNYNQNGTVGLAKGGAAESVLSAVDDAAKLADAGLSAFGPYVYKLDNSGGGSNAYVEIDGYVDENSPWPDHSSQVRVRGDSGELKTNGATTSKSFDASTDYQLVENEGWQPNSKWNKLKIVVGAGKTIYFTLFQMSASGNCTSVIPNDTDGVEVSRASEATEANGLYWTTPDDFSALPEKTIFYKTPDHSFWVLDDGTPEYFRDGDSVSAGEIPVDVQVTANKVACVRNNDIVTVRDLRIYNGLMSSEFLGAL